MFKDSCLADVESVWRTVWETCQLALRTSLRQRTDCNRRRTNIWNLPKNTTMFYIVLFAFATLAQTLLFCSPIANHLVTSKFVVVVIMRRDIPLTWPSNPRRILTVCTSTSRRCLPVHSKTPFNLTLSGITNDDVDLSVDALKAVTLPLLKHFGVAEEGGLELKVRFARKFAARRHVPLHCFHGSTNRTG